MSQTVTLDPFKIWKDMYEKTESTWRGAIQDTLGTEQFAQGLGQIQNQYVQYQEVVNTMTESYLKQVNIPSREEIAKVASLIINVDTKIDDMEDLIDEQKDSTTSEIDQLKKDVNNLNHKLDQVLELLKK
ncbi:polyhydroxyalkanoate biosynthesis repressor PhaR [Rummeliibacillus sp. NPDC094406]|uniref:polyhydroxyalkanoate biosynthesis repressor PhaR n=1 Tax=Rummeliibacillus sp. NPDC094406 TaxID=3364511 RepID=UPI003810F439